MNICVPAPILSAILLLNIMLNIIAKEDTLMSTRSILKNVDIRKKKMGTAFVSALENASSKKSKDIPLSRTYKDVKGDAIRSIFKGE